MDEDLNSNLCGFDSNYLELIVYCLVIYILNNKQLDNGHSLAKLIMIENRCNKNEMGFKTLNFLNK